MKHEFVLQGLHCANCAAKIEAKLEKRYGDVRFSFATLELEIRTDKAGYEKLLIGMMKCADDGDEVTFSVKDRDLVTDKWFDSAIKKAKKKLTKSPVFGDFSGGILISGKGSDKNFTLEVELAGVREEYEPQIAKLIFGE